MGMFIALERVGKVRTNIFKGLTFGDLVTASDRRFLTKRAVHSGARLVFPLASFYILPVASISFRTYQLLGGTQGCRSM